MTMFAILINILPSEYFSGQYSGHAISCSSDGRYVTICTNYNLLVSNDFGASTKRSWAMLSLGLAAKDVLYRPLMYYLVFRCYWLYKYIMCVVLFSIRVFYNIYLIHDLVYHYHLKILEHFRPVNPLIS